MSRTTGCPDKCALLALAAEDAASPEVRAHVAACPSCRRIVRRLKAEIGHLRSSLAPKPPPEPPPPGSTQTAGD